jgi:arylsulfatase
VTADVDVPQGGGDGMLATAGGKWGGWAMYILKGKPVFHYNMLILAQYHWEGADALAPGKHRLVFDYTYDGPGIGKGGTGVLKVDDKVVATQKQANSIAFLQIADETFDVGMDTRSSVNEKDYQVPFAFNGKIDKLTVKLGPPQILSPEQQKAMAAAIRAKD